MEQERVVAVLGGRDPVGEPAIKVVRGIKSVAPRLGRKRGVGHRVVERLQAAVAILEMRLRKGVVLPDLSRRAVVQDHVHLRERGRRVVHFLAVDRDVHRRLVVGLQQQRARAAGRIVNRLIAASGPADPDHLGHDTRNLRRGVELALALARLRGEVLHQILVCVAQNVVALGAVAPEVERRGVEDRDQVREPVHHFLALAQLVGVVEVGHIDHALEVVRLRQAADDLVDLLADLLVALQRHHVGKPAADRYIDQGIPLPGILVRNVFHEQQGQHVVLVLRGVHATAKFVAAPPERPVELGFFDGHFRRGYQGR